MGMEQLEQRWLLVCWAESPLRAALREPWKVQAQTQVSKKAAEQGLNSDVM